jgi:hypothetical protein
VTFLGDGCFSSCSALRSVSFCSGSRLSCIPEKAFTHCYGLESLVLPSTVKTLGASCFSNCWKLANSPLPADSEPVRIGKQAFESCHSLKSFSLPPSVEFVGERCFDKCISLSNLTFQSPSHLRELLDIPFHLAGFVCVPDSVEILSFIGLFARSGDRVLRFGDESIE